MLPAPLPKNEDERLKELQELEILDTPPESDFDDLTLLAAQICVTPVSMISLVDGDRQWYKSKRGTELQSTPRDISFCGYTVGGSDLFVVPDTHADKRFADNPLVTGDEQVRFYAGAPLLTPEGNAVGALCVVDNAPRVLTAQQADALRALARQVMAQMKLRQSVTRLAKALISQQAAEKQLEHSARHDGLTGLPNRTLFLDRLERCLVRSRRGTVHHFAVLFLDLDRFKIVNDSLGHAAGDYLLKIVAERLSDCVRDADTVGRAGDRPSEGASEQSKDSATVARLGGDEFTLLLESLQTPADAARVAERILARLALPITFQGQELTVSGSIGIVMNGGTYRTAAELLRDADVAMYRAKLTGRGRYMLFDATMQTAVLSRLRIEADLRHALARGELLLHYQPIVNLETGTPKGLEALVRWRRPDGTLVSPAEFIPVAEETGLIVPIGTWVLRESCRQLAEWHHDHPELSSLWMSINLSRRQLADPNLVSVVKGILEENGVDPQSIKLEITESLVIDDDDHSAGRVLAGLRALGLQLSMDDFGTGYSSLSCLHRFPIDVLKIDRAFIRHVTATKNTTAVVEAIVSLAHALDITVVAEGLETLEQVETLRRLSCDQGQGFFFSKPLPPDAARRFLLSHEPGLQVTLPARSRNARRPAEAGA